MYNIEKVIMLSFSVLLVLFLFPTCFSFPFPPQVTPLLFPLFPPPLFPLTLSHWLSLLPLLRIFMIKSWCFLHLPINHSCFSYLVPLCGLVVAVLLFVHHPLSLCTAVFIAPQSFSPPSLFMPLVLSFALHVSPLLHPPCFLPPLPLAHMQPL